MTKKKKAAKKTPAKKAATDQTIEVDSLVSELIAIEIIFHWGGGLNNLLEKPLGAGRLQLPAVRVWNVDFCLTLRTHRHNLNRHNLHES